MSAAIASTSAQEITPAQVPGMTNGVDSATPIETTSTPTSRSDSPAHDSRGALGLSSTGANSKERSSSRQRLTDAVKKVFGSHGHEMNFADEQGLERKSRDASRSASRAGSRSASRAASPSRLSKVIGSHGHDLNFANAEGLERKSREASKSRDSPSGSREASRSRNPISKILGSHGHDLNFADAQGLERKSRDQSRSASRAGSRAGSRAPSPSRAAHSDALGSSATLR